MELYANVSGRCEQQASNQKRKRWLPWMKLFRRLFDFGFNGLEFWLLITVALVMTAALRPGMRKRVRV